MIRSHSVPLALAALASIASAHGCGSSADAPTALSAGTDPGASGGAGLDFGLDDADPEAPAPGNGGAGTTQPATPPSADGNTFPSTDCIAGSTACTNCIDDDGDGSIDAFDPECTGPLDDDERSFATGIPGDNIDFCQDCFFDGNSGHGDDGCEYNTECLYGRTPNTPAQAACFRCEVSDTCRDTCRPFTPNGCDCFGCCEVHDGRGGVRNVRLAAGCSRETLDDPDACEACVPTPDCFNDCGPCEICIGRPGPGPDCTDDPASSPAPRCRSGQQSCDADSPCPSTQYCLTGCCIDATVIR